MEDNFDISSFDPHPAFRAKGREADRIEPRNPPVKPLADLNGRAPVALPPIGAKERGIDLAYQRNDSTDLMRTYPPGSPNGTSTHFMPTSMPAFCVGDGVVRYAGRVAHGYSIVVDHRNGWATYFGSLEHVFVPTDRDTRRPETRVKAGDVLGYVGSLQPGGFKCLHFELWRRDAARLFIPIDPTKFMNDWRAVAWNQDHLTPIEPAAAKVAA
jgi:hypothetical protein